MHSVAEKWEEFLDPNILRGRLISASIYIAAYEMLKDSIIERIKSFFDTGFDPDGTTTSPEYAKKVLSRNRSPLHASLDSLLENEVIDQADFTAFETIRLHRNKLAHEMTSVVVGTATLGYLEYLPTIAALLKKIEVWWIVNLEIPINPDLDDAVIDEAGIMPGPSISLQLMMEVALGSAAESRRYLDAFRKHSPTGHKN